MAGVFCKSRCTCPYNEKHKECESECSPTCQTPLPPSDAPCTTPCTNCTCKEGFIRDEYSGRCVEFDKCPKCPPNEEFVECARHCQTTCDNTITDSKANCRLDCATCVCKEGYIREMAGGRCIPASGCIRCSINEIRNDCASPCLPEPTCQNPNPKPDPDRGCVAVCLPRCDCDNGFIRDGITRKCVRLNNCPSSVKY
ncbi:hypothetical protein RI129_007909 [Pyrocoelia pectoralis]|uniref:EGF-like domain-containing protein n=1 Tax=Pyrocoelia pectoralis TaxID=417401 RepID=A0AAN7VD77_9COLE